MHRSSSNIRRPIYTAKMRKIQEGEGPKVMRVKLIPDVEGRGPMFGFFIDAERLKQFSVLEFRDLEDRIVCTFRQDLMLHG